MKSHTSLIISLLVLLYLLYRQRQIRKVSEKVPLRLPVILGILGLYNLVKYFDYQTLTANKLTWIILSLLVLAIGMGSLRAFTVRVWSEDNGIFRQGTWLTVGLWIVSVALHMTVDRIGGIGDSTLLVYYGITLAVQSFVVQSRAKHIFSKS